MSQEPTPHPITDSLTRYYDADGNLVFPVAPPPGQTAEEQLRAAMWEDYAIHRGRDIGNEGNINLLLAKEYPVWCAGWQAARSQDELRAVLEEIAAYPIPNLTGFHLVRDGVTWERLARSFMDMAQAALEANP